LLFSGILRKDVPHCPGDSSAGGSFCRKLSIMMPVPADLSLKDFLPHRGGMLLIGEVVEVDTERAVTSSTVGAAWPMVSDGAVSPLVMVELAAQTAGVCNGWERIQSRGLDSEQMGWLVAIKRAEFHVDCLAVGSTVRVTAENALVFDRFREVTSQVFLGNRLVAEVILQLYQV
jgi:predicted hotdog family 3-hydroxylacyl-ACP dehydratase